MNILARNFFPPAKLALRFISQRTSPAKLHEIVKIIDPQSSIKISSALKLVIRPYDLLECPDANKLRASILTRCSRSTADLSVEVNGTSVDITSDNIKGNTDSLQCLLEVPVKADLDIQADQNADVSNVHSDLFHLLCKGNVFTKNIHSTTISIQSEGGNINSSGILLANKIGVNTTGTGVRMYILVCEFENNFLLSQNIILDKLQGDIFHCKTENGNISTNSCYVDSSNFATETGTLNLKNVHKKSEVYVLKEGDINMSE